MLAGGPFSDERDDAWPTTGGGVDGDDFDWDGDDGIEVETSDDADWSMLAVVNAAGATGRSDPKTIGSEGSKGDPFTLPLKGSIMVFSCLASG